MIRNLFTLERPMPLLLALTLAGCARCDSSVAPGSTAEKPAEIGAPGASTAEKASEPTWQLVDHLFDCDLEHRGVLVDASPKALIGSFGWQVDAPAATSFIEESGATIMRVASKRTSIAFYQAEATPIQIAARGRAALTSRVSVYIDDHPVGTLTFNRNDLGIAHTSVTGLPLDSGLHTLSLVAAARSRADGETLYELDWLRVGPAEEDESAYGAPTYEDVVRKAASLGGVPHRAVALRAPGTLRCPIHVGTGLELRVSIGLQGKGQGAAEIRLRRDGEPPVALDQIALNGSGTGEWRDLRIPLDRFSGSIAFVELVAKEAPPGTRILFGDPAFAARTTPEPAPPKARAVVIVVLDGVEKTALPPWSSGQELDLPFIKSMAREATVFDNHRAPTTLIAGSFATLLTGLLPIEHTLNDKNARLPTGIPTVGRIARDAGIRAALFTGVPQTFGAFGFGSGWERFTEFPPFAGDAATAPIDRAAQWITEVSNAEKGGRLLAVVHARGGHPPWDVSEKEVSQLGPPDYTGLFEPRRSAQLLAASRKRKTERLSPADRTRIAGMFGVALRGQDKALANLVDELKHRNLWDETLFVVTGDVGSGISEDALFADGLDLRESLLMLPLYVHFPGGVLRGTRVSNETMHEDITLSALHALGLESSLDATELGVIASSHVPLPDGPALATLGDRFSARWGPWVLLGRIGAPPSLCDLRADPLCVFNRREALPIAARTMFRRMAAEVIAKRSPVDKRQPASIDSETSASLSVFGEGLGE